MPNVPGSGRAPLSQGMIATARRRADAVDEALEPYIQDGRDVLVIEPSDLAMFRTEYDRLLPKTRANRIRDASFELFEYVDALLEGDIDASELDGSDSDERVAFHSHCQQRTLGLESHTIAVLERLGYTVKTSDVECCGMAGSFGYKLEYYDLSADIGLELCAQLAATGSDHVVASGTSCNDQIASLGEIEPVHPAELIAPDRSLNTSNTPTNHP